MPPQLTIVGLGPGNPAQRTLGAQQELAAASRIILRTRIHPGLEEFDADPRVSSCDDLYEKHGSFEQVYAAVVDRVLTAAQSEPIVFAVPGHPLIGEHTVTALLAACTELGIETRIVSGISALDVITERLGIDAMASEAQVIDATQLQQFTEAEPFNSGLPDLSPLRPVLLCQVYSQPVASAAKLALGRLYPDDHPIQVITAAGVDSAERIDRIRLFELDRVPVDHLTSVWIEPMPRLAASHLPLTLHHIVARLRAPDGCPWDRKQTYASLRDSGIEEAYEVAQAIDDDDLDNLAEELGDVLLHVAMQAQIAEEAGDFSIGDVYDHVNRKLIRRHPHVFGDVQAETPDRVVETWDGVKAAERAARGLAPKPDDPFDRLPRAMPVMRRVVEADRSRRTDRIEADGDTLGDELLAVLSRFAGSDLDPELELERAYRRRVERDRQA